MFGVSGFAAGVAGAGLFGLSGSGLATFTGISQASFGAGIAASDGGNAGQVIAAGTLGFLGGFAGGIAAQSSTKSIFNAKSLSDVFTSAKRSSVSIATGFARKLGGINPFSAQAAAGAAAGGSLGSGGSGDICQQVNVLTCPPKTCPHNLV